MASTRKKGQQNTRLFSKLDESNTVFVIEQSNHEAQVGSRTMVVELNLTSNNMTGSIEINCQQEHMQTLQDALLTAIENLVLPRVPRNQPMHLQDGVLTVIYWNLTREIFRVTSKTYK